MYQFVPWIKKFEPYGPSPWDHFWPALRQAGQIILYFTNFEYAILFIIYVPIMYLIFRLIGQMVPKS